MFGTVLSFEDVEESLSGGAVDLLEQRVEVIICLGRAGDVGWVELRVPDVGGVLARQ